MTARICRLCTALFVSLAAWLHQPAVVISCGPYYDGEDVHIVNFDPRVLPDSLYDLFMGIAMSPAVGMTQEDLVRAEDTASAVDTTYDRNIREWGEYFGGNVPLADLDLFVYTDSTIHLQRLLDSIRLGRSFEPPMGMNGKLAAREIARRRDTTMLRYMIFAKLCQEIDWYDPHDWSAATTVNPIAIDSLVARGRAEVAACGSDAIRLRYGYQLVRLTHYGNRNEESLGLYDSLIASSPAPGTIRYRAMTHRAAVAWKIGRRAESLYLLSIVFDRYPERLWTAMVDFRVDSESTWRGAYAMARSDHERSVLWMLRGLTEYRLSIGPMAAMVTLQPRDPMLDVMLMREVREVERRLYSERVTRPVKLRRVSAARGTARIELDGWTWAAGWTDSADEQRYPTRLARFAERCADQKLVADRPLWYAVAAYMRIMDGSYAEAERDLDRAGATLGENRKLALQIGVLRLLARARSGRYLSNDLASRYAEALSWIRGYSSDMRPYTPALVMLGQKYLLQGDVARAAAAFAKGGNDEAVGTTLDMYASDADLLRLERLLERPWRGIDTLLFSGLGFTAGDIRGIRATRMARQGRFAQAVALWDEGDHLVRYTVTPGPRPVDETFSATIDTLLPSEAPEDWSAPKREFTRESFAREMLRLERLARRSRRDAERYNYAIARALQSTPYWGYVGELWNGSLVSTLRYFFKPVDYPFNVPVLARRMARGELRFLREYGSNELAWRYLDKARRATLDPEFAARCAHEMDEALKNPQTSYHRTPERQDRTGYHMLRTRYRKTAYAERVLSWCGTYEWFTTHK